MRVAKERDAVGGDRHAGRIAICIVARRLGARDPDGHVAAAMVFFHLPAARDHDTAMGTEVRPPKMGARRADCGVASGAPRYPGQRRGR